MVTEAVKTAQSGSEKKFPPLELVARPTTASVPSGEGLSSASRDWREVGREHEVAATVCGPVAKASLTGVPGVTVSVCLAVCRPEPEMVIEGVPACVSAK